MFKGRNEKEKKNIRGRIRIKKETIILIIYVFGYKIKKNEK